MLNIVIPMAGQGSRFKQAGFKTPKPFIDVNGRPMIERVVGNLSPYEPHRFIFLARREHEQLIKTHMSFATDIVWVDELTEGAACTVLLAKELINNNDPLVIANSDQLVKWNDGSKTKRALMAGHIDSIVWRESDNIQDMINDAVCSSYAATMATFYSNHPKWSYAKLYNDEVEMVAEKQVISNHATVGIYWYSQGRHFVKAAERMIAKDVRVNGEFYVCPVFNELIHGDSFRVGIYPVKRMMGMGTPVDLDRTKEILDLDA